MRSIGRRSARATPMIGAVTSASTQASGFDSKRPEPRAERVVDAVRRCGIDIGIDALEDERVDRQRLLAPSSAAAPPSETPIAANLLAGHAAARTKSIAAAASRPSR